MVVRPPIVRVLEKYSSGKTRLTVVLVREMKERGSRVAAIKHCPHGQ